MKDFSSPFCILSEGKTWRAKVTEAVGGTSVLSVSNSAPPLFSRLSPSCHIVLPMPLVKPRPRAPPPIPTDRPTSLRTPLGSPSPTGPNFNLHSSSSGSSSPSSSIVRLQANSDNSSSDGGHSTSSQVRPTPLQPHPFL